MSHTYTQMGTVSYVYGCAAAGVRRVALELIQRNIRKWQSNKNWSWYKLLIRIKPLIAMARSEEEMKEKLAQFDKVHDTLEKTKGLIVQVQEQHVHLQKEKDELEAKLTAETDKVDQMEEKIVDFLEKKAEYLETIKEVSACVRTCLRASRRAT